MKDFDPNAPEEQKNYQWATYVPLAGSSRHTKFKHHSKLQFALSAVDGNTPVTLYEKVGDVWEKRFERNHRESVPDNADCEKCGKKYDSGFGFRLRWEWKREGRKVVQPVQRVLLCFDCSQRAKGR